MCMLGSLSICVHCIIAIPTEDNSADLCFDRWQRTGCKAKAHESRSTSRSRTRSARKGPTKELEPSGRFKTDLTLGTKRSNKELDNTLMSMPNERPCLFACGPCSCTIQTQLYSASYVPKLKLLCLAINILFA